MTNTGVMQGCLRLRHYDVNVIYYMLLNIDGISQGYNISYTPTFILAANIFEVLSGNCYISDFSMFRGRTACRLYVNCSCPLVVWMSSWKSCWLLCNVYISIHVFMYISFWIMQRASCSTTGGSVCLGQRLRRRLPPPHVGLFVDLLLGNLRWLCVLLSREIMVCSYVENVLLNYEKIAAGWCAWKVLKTSL